ncbi:MAG: hypothetical protein WCP11_00100 [Candidatus Saccharibacteria bacterium]
MTDKKKIHKNLRRLQRFKTWKLLILFLLAAFLAATFLRLNNIGMVQRREAVLAADEVGDDQVTQNRLYDLQRYVSEHMNTDIGKGIYLIKKYDKDVQAVYDAASADTNPNGNIYKKAQEVCAPQFTNWSYDYIKCTTVELAKYPAAGDLASSVRLPRADSYLHSYVSPLWSPDFAGVSVLVCGVFLLMLLARFVGILILELLLGRHYKSI